MESRPDTPPTNAPAATLGESLRQSEERFQLLVNSIHDYAIFMLDPGGHIQSWNPGAQEIKGYNADEIIGKHFSIFYTPDAVARRWPQFELQVAAEQGRFEDEGWRVRKDGSRFWANVIITALRDTTGTLVGFAKITRDLTERRAHEERLRESEERLRLIIESVQDYAIFMVDPTGVVASWNRGAERITGYTAAEIIGQHFSRFFSREDIAERAPERELREALQLGRTEYEGWRLRKDGSRFWANVVITPLLTSAGEHRGFVKVTRDLTQRRQVEALEQSNRRINEFLAMLAHELRNPLAPIRNAITVMQRVETQEPTIAWARDVIDRQAGHLSRLVDDLLDISRITSGKITLRRELVDLNEVVLRAVEAARPQVESRQHALAVEMVPEPLTVSGDTTRLLQVFVNLLNNAAKYTPDKGRIAVTSSRQGDEARVTVRDNGIGIAPHLLPKVFDLFAQGDRSLARSEGGLGIGLTLARRLVDMHAGEIDARSAGVNQGAEFTVRLPLARPVRIGGGPELPPPPVESRLCRVLVVDDNEDSAQTMAMLLALSGHVIRIAHDGASALEITASFRPHVVLLDIGLPGMDGYDVARQLRARPDMAKTTLVAMTGYGQEDDRRRSSEAGFAHHLVKPIDVAALERVIASAACEG
jgi:PAS domain S-box-containing protein